MPIPTFAFTIMLTSLAPSPIANVVILGMLFYTISTISAFCHGDTLQHSTVWLSVISFINESLRLWLWSICYRVSPVTTTEYLNLAMFSLLFKKACICYSSLTLLSSSRITMGISFFKRLHEWPMLIAVSSLSPVRIHTLMPAWMNVSIHNGTSS